MAKHIIGVTELIGYTFEVDGPDGAEQFATFVKKHLADWCAAASSPSGITDDAVREVDSWAVVERDWWYADSEYRP